MRYTCYFGSLLMLLFLSACQPADAPLTTENQPALNAPSNWDDMSVFHLPAGWVSQHGDTLSLSDLRGYVLVTVMIYTSCQAACPRLVADMRRIETQVSEAGGKRVKYLLISIDPVNDTPERMKRFAKLNQMEANHWLFLQGTESSVQEMANVLAVKYKQISPIDFSHSNIISVFDQEGVLQHQMEGLSVNNEATVNTILKLSGAKLGS